MFQLGREPVFQSKNGTTYILSRLERRIVEEFRDWIAHREGDPFEEIKILAEHLDPAEAKAMIAEARSIKQQIQAFSLGCPLSMRYLNTETGQAELTYLLLREKQPTITRDEAFRIWTEMTREQFVEAVEKANGVAPEKNAEAGEAPPTHLGTTTPSVGV